MCSVGIESLSRHAKFVELGERVGFRLALVSTPLNDSLAANVGIVASQRARKTGQSLASHCRMSWSAPPDQSNECATARLSHWHVPEVFSPQTEVYLRLQYFVQYRNLT